jgi:hypothetical protein
MSVTGYVAFHSFARMGYEYAARPSDDFSFKSNRSRHFLERAIGHEVWVVEGRRDAEGQTRYALAAVFTPEEIVAEAEWRIVRGEHGRSYSPPIPLDGQAWIHELLEEQDRFRVGFGETRVPAALAGLSALAKASDTEVAPVSVEAPPKAAVPCGPAMPPGVSPTDNGALRTIDWLRQRRGRYYCKHCLSREVGITPIAQVSRIVRLLEQAPKEWRNSEAPCAGCGRDRNCVAWVG